GMLRRRAASEVREERFEVVTPLVADPNPASAVPREILSADVVAAASHGGPRGPLRANLSAGRLAVRGASLHGQLGRETSTTAGGPLEVARVASRLVAAVASHDNVAPCAHRPLSPVRPIHQANDRPSTEASSNLQG